VVDGITGEHVESANAKVKVDYDNFVGAFGMEALLN